jgi:signal transduction histidine kinase
MAEHGKMQAEKRNDADVVTCFDTIIESSIKLSDLMKRILDFSKRGELTRGTVYITELLEGVIKLYNSQYVHERVNLVTDLQEVPTIDGYAAGLESVFVNMLTNSIQAYADIPKERPKSVQVRTYHKEGHIFVEFEDDACGIKKEDLPRIFDAWYTTKGKKGHGLGLAYAKMIVEDSHFGKLCVESEQGAGTKFTIKIPDAKSVKLMREETFFGPKREPSS